MTNETPTANRARQRKYKHTRQIVRMALDDGMTQKEVARLCRTQQSVVSGWANGAKKAGEHQVAPLIERFGHRLNRASSRVYLVSVPPDVPWEETDEAQDLRDITAFAESQGGSDSERAMLQARLDHRGWGHLHRLRASDWDAVARQTYEARRSQIIRVEGRVIFRHAFEEPEVVHHGSNREPSLRWHAVRRWALHEQARNRFRLVVSDVRRIDPREWKRYLLKRGVSSGARLKRLETNNLVHSRDDAGRWLSDIEGPFDLESLLQRTDALTAEESVHDRATVPFLLRKQLVERGYDVPGVLTLGAESEVQESASPNLGEETE